MATIKIAPVNRIEGHLDIDATTGTANRVDHVENKCVMFRGIETIMVMRDPRDAPIITSRV